MKIPMEQYNIDERCTYDWQQDQMKQMDTENVLPRLRNLLMGRATKASSIDRIALIRAIRTGTTLPEYTKEGLNSLFPRYKELLPALERLAEKKRRWYAETTASLNP